MADHRTEFTETLKRLLRVNRHEVEAEEREWQAERKAKIKDKTG